MTRWPALMLRRTAAEYCDMSEPAFEREVTAGRFPGPFLIGGKDHWRKDALDAAIARLGSSGSNDPMSKLKARYGKQEAA